MCGVVSCDYPCPLPQDTATTLRAGIASEQQHAEYKRAEPFEHRSTYESKGCIGVRFDGISAYRRTIRRVLELSMGRRGGILHLRIWLVRRNFNLCYPNNSSTSICHPGTVGSASAISPLRKITGLGGSLAL